MTWPTSRRLAQSARMSRNLSTPEWREKAGMLPTDAYAQIEAARAQGRPVKAIAWDLGVCASTVYEAGKRRRK